MELRQLRYFVKMVESGNMTRAASELHIAQSALSQQLMNLESSIGTRLFDRSVHGLTPTHAGAMFYKYAKVILRQVEDTTLAMHTEVASPSGEVVVAMPSSSARLIAIPLLKRVVANYPNIRLRLYEHPSADIPRMLARAEVDVAVMVDIFPGKTLQVHPLLREDMFAVFPIADAPASKRVSLRDLLRFPLILPNAQNSIRVQLDIACAKRHLGYSLVAEVNITSLLVQAVRNGLGASVLPWSVVAEYCDAGLMVARPLVRPAIQRELLLCVSNDIQPSPATRIVLQIIKRICGEIVESGAWLGIQSIAKTLAQSKSVC